MAQADKWRDNRDLKKHTEKNRRWYILKNSTNEQMLHCHTPYIEVRNRFCAKTECSYGLLTQFTSLNRTRPFGTCFMINKCHNWDQDGWGEYAISHTASTKKKMKPSCLKAKWFSHVPYHVKSTNAQVCTSPRTTDCLTWGCVTTSPKTCHNFLWWQDKRSFDCFETCRLQLTREAIAKRKNPRLLSET